MDVLVLARVQFALTIMFHYLYVPFSIGLGLMLVLMEGTYLVTGNKLYERMTRFFVKIFALTFAVGVATGIVMEFQFGTNWSRYSRFVGDVFGSALAAEGIFAFFLESGFLALLVFGWDRVGKKTHFLATAMVALGSTFSAVWIVIANSWMQTPAGHRIVGEGHAARAQIVDFWAMVFNPSSMTRLAHVLGGCWLAGAFLVLSISAWYALKGKHFDFAKAGFRFGLAVALTVGLYQLITGHSGGGIVAKHQPAKLAAMEGHFKTGPADLYLLGRADEERGVTTGLAIPGGLGLLLFGDPHRSIPGLDAFAPADRPPVNRVFQAYHLMVAIGFTLIGLSLAGVVLLWRERLFRARWLLWCYVFAVGLPPLANQAGWTASEVGRQPWIVYGLMRTEAGISPNVDAGQILFSVLLFSFVYLLLFALFIFLLNGKIKHGPEDGPARTEPGLHRADA